MRFEKIWAEQCQAKAIRSSDHGSWAIPFSFITRQPIVVQSGGIRCEGDPNIHAARFPAIHMVWLQRCHLETDVEEPPGGGFGPVGVLRRRDPSQLIDPCCAIRDIAGQRIRTTLSSGGQNMFRLIATMRRGSATGVAAAWARYETH